MTPQTVAQTMHRLWVASVRYWLPTRSIRDSRRYALGPRDFGDNGGWPVVGGGIAATFSPHRLPHRLRKTRSATGNRYGLPVAGEPINNAGSSGSEAFHASNRAPERQR